MYSTPGLRSAHVAVRCDEHLRDFAERMLLFSQKHTFRPTVNATRQPQKGRAIPIVFIIFRDTQVAYT